MKPRPWAGRPIDGGRRGPGAVSRLAAASGRRPRTEATASSARPARAIRTRRSPGVFCQSWKLFLRWSPAVENSGCTNNLPYATPVRASGQKTSRSRTNGRRSILYIIFILKGRRLSTLR